MAREKEGKIRWIEDKCHLKVGFESENGEMEVKFIPVEQLTDFIDDTFNLNDICIKATIGHKKLDDIKTIYKCD